VTKVEDLLRDLLNDLEALDKMDDGMGDTDVREQLSDAVYDGFIDPEPSYRLPWSFGLFSVPGNLRARRALNRYIRRAKKRARELGLETPMQREAAFANYDVRSDGGADVDDFFGGVGDEYQPAPPPRVPFDLPPDVYDALRSAAEIEITGNTGPDQGDVEYASSTGRSGQGERTPEYAAVRHWIKNEIYRKQKNYQAALRELRLAVAADPTHTGTRLDLAKALDMDNQMREAISEYRQVLAVDPTNQDARRSLENALKHLGEE
jgi:tetratricopeptide (TPR) repeat protein